MELKDYDRKVDIWASGIFGTDIFLGHHPWPLSVNPWRTGKTSKIEDYKAHHFEFLQSLKQYSKSQRDFIRVVPGCRYVAIGTLMQDHHLKTH